MDRYPLPIQFGAFPGERDQIGDHAAKIAKIKVLYRELTLIPVTWLDIYKATTGQSSDEFPTGAGAKMTAQWLQYKLNALGYLAGPLTGEKNEQTRRALRRYSYNHEGMEESDDESKQDLIAELKAGAKARPHLIEKPGVLIGAEASSKIVLDHNYYFVNQNGLGETCKGVGNANELDGHSVMDAAKLDRFEVPLKVSASLVSQDDPDGSKPGVQAPEAIGPVLCEWHVFDPPEAQGVVDPQFKLPTLSNGTKAEIYLQQVRTTLAPTTKDDPLDARDNCPTSRGGARPDDPNDMTGYFHKSGLPGVLPDECAGPKYLSAFHTDLSLSWQRSWLGTSAALFRGSYIAGDNWIVQARLSFEGHPRKDQLAQDHRSLAMLAQSLGDDVRLDKSRDPLLARTGMMTLWRRQRVRRVIDWWDYAAPPEINWDVLCAAFRAAFIELIPPPHQVQGIDTLITGEKRAEYLSLFKDIITAQKIDYLQFAEKDLAWTNQAIFPIEWKKQGGDEPSTTWLFKVDCKNAISKINGGLFPYAMYRVPAYFLKKLIDRQDEAGLIVVRFQQFRSYDLNQLLNPTDRGTFNAGNLLHFDGTPLTPANAAARMPNYKSDERGNGGPSIGVDWGVAMLQHQHFATYKDTFITLHEMGHCLYLTHAHDPTKRGDHDQNDINCAMYYPETNGLATTVDWGLRVTPSGKSTAPHFCGKCLLKLRGWKVQDTGGSPSLPAGSPLS